MWQRLRGSLTGRAGLVGAALCNVKGCLIQESNVDIILRIMKSPPCEHEENIIV